MVLSNYKKMYMKEVFMMKKRDLKKIDDVNELRFNMTPDMSDMFIEIVTIRQMLKENKLNEEERKLFEKELKELTTLFVLEFRKNNVEERKKYNELMNK